MATETNANPMPATKPSSSFDDSWSSNSGTSF